ncbi:hypothetical protein VZ94_14730 [Methylocucumis oryzae]|uniref:Uncharacterized protein n=1 Tax=Methylocucumis oryzae TaxID=1632867 RepID=A0A0F3IHA2_9GAMM|nr:hypothetical protein VZ94_14730 [Methylocucumis oryzae]
MLVEQKADINWHCSLSVIADDFRFPARLRLKKPAEYKKKFLPSLLNLVTNILRYWRLKTI